MYTLINWIVVDNTTYLFSCYEIRGLVVSKRLKPQNSDPQRGHLQPAD